MDAARLGLPLPRGALTASAVYAIAVLRSFGAGCVFWLAPFDAKGMRSPDRKVGASALKLACALRELFHLIGLMLHHTRGRNMKKLVLTTLASAAMFASVGAASAQVYYSGPGYGLHIGPRYEDRYENRYEDRDDDRYERRRYRYRESRDDDRRYRTFNGCPRNYTVQDGVCKPYTGR